MLCEKCGTENKEGTSYCKKCGEDLFEKITSEEISEEAPVTEKAAEPEEETTEAVAEVAPEKNDDRVRTSPLAVHMQEKSLKEDKKIRKLDFVEENTFSKRQNGMTSEDRRLLDSNFRELGNKINEIIDKLNEGE